MKITENNRIIKLIEELNQLNKYSLQIGIFGEDDSFIAMLAQVHEFGVTIRPKGRFLVIPLMKKYKGKNPSQFDLFFMQTKENHKFLVRNKGKDQLEFAYMLAEQVTIPERSFIRSTFDEQSRAWSDYALTLVKKLIDGKMTATELMNRLGLRMQRDIQRTIRNLSDPPNSPITTNNKKSSNPLIDTGKLRQSVTYKVVKS
ncbi:hypothetical protein [Enterococcus faecalis]|uniref:hypothetical protein n=1 Tax=Enterococcus faecalis TaxID=1351 RepID=UPI000354913A|nr:hypothetical protein [Enterococcus faecalis]EGO5846005.1 hypothetical protein [Enterococcus faecalis]EPH81662.1 hypothetical protein D924_02564 [Enterococcus faecalis 06-MB-S-10]EPH87024.1 hypothetical protein D923_02484 [Enterococcus faecalis 06-MB-S-04]EPI33994.1 hypothetical protein D349_00424 [Enterococcus faecalis UP2S-6]